MTLIETFRDIEKCIGEFYAPSFYEFIEEFSKRSIEPEFNFLFKKFHFCNEAEVRDALNTFMPEEFIPFFVAEQNGCEDYYCFDRENSENKDRIVVFSRDAIVFEWASYIDFLSWMQNEMNEKNHRDQS
jgi:hypothetical protein